MFKSLKNVQKWKLGALALSASCGLFGAQGDTKATRALERIRSEEMRCKAAKAFAELENTAYIAWRNFDEHRTNLDHRITEIETKLALFKAVWPDMEKYLEGREISDHLDSYLATTNWDNNIHDFIVLRQKAIRKIQHELTSIRTLPQGQQVERLYHCWKFISELPRVMTKKDARVNGIMSKINAIQKKLNAKEALQRGESPSILAPGSLSREITGMLKPQLISEAQRLYWEETASCSGDFLQELSDEIDKIHKDMDTLQMVIKQPNIGDILKEARKHLNVLQSDDAVLWRKINSAVQWLKDEMTELNKCLIKQDVHSDTWKELPASFQEILKKFRQLPQIDDREKAASYQLLSMKHDLEVLLRHNKESLNEDEANIVIRCADFMMETLNKTLNPPAMLKNKLSNLISGFRKSLSHKGAQAILDALNKCRAKTDWIGPNYCETDEYHMITAENFGAREKLALEEDCRIFRQLEFERLEMEHQVHAIRKKGNVDSGGPEALNILWAVSKLPLHKLPSWLQNITGKGVTPEEYESCKKYEHLEKQTEQLRTSLLQHGMLQHEIDKLVVFPDTYIFRSIRSKGLTKNTNQTSKRDDSCTDCDKKSIAAENRQIPSLESQDGDTGEGLQQIISDMPGQPITQQFDTKYNADNSSQARLRSQGLTPQESVPSYEDYAAQLLRGHLDTFARPRGMDNNYINEIVRAWQNDSEKVWRAWRTLPDYRQNSQHADCHLRSILPYMLLTWLAENNVNNPLWKQSSQLYHVTPGFIATQLDASKQFMKKPPAISQRIHQQWKTAGMPSFGSCAFPLLTIKPDQSCLIQQQRAPAQTTLQRLFKKAPSVSQLATGGAGLAFCWAAYRLYRGDSVRDIGNTVKNSAANALAACKLYNTPQSATQNHLGNLLRF
jgi:hypothetical protein